MVGDGQRGSCCYFVGSSVVLGGLVELRGFFLTGDDVQFSESGSPGPGLERFSPFSASFGDRPSADVGEGDAEALGAGQDVSPGFGRGNI